MKRKNPIKKSRTPKGIKVEELDDEFRFYKIWSGNVVAKEPFLITTEIADVVERYHEYCTKWNLNPDMKLVYKLVSNNNQKVESNENNFLKGGIF